MSTKTDARETMDAILDLLLDALEQRRQQRETLDNLAADVAVTPDFNEILEEPIAVEPTIVGTPLPKSWQPHINQIAPDTQVLEQVTPALIGKIAETNSYLLHDMSLATAQTLSDEALDTVPLELFNQLDADVQQHIMERLGIVEDDPPLAPPIEVDEVSIASDPEPIRSLPMPSTGMHHTVRRMFVVLIFFVILSNIPINYSQLNEWLGTSAADGVATIRVAREGMLIRMTGSNRVYVMENNKRRWITTPEAFVEYGYRWSAVREVNSDFLNEFEEGDPIYVLVQCFGSPHIYVLDARGISGQRVKRWIKDVPTLESMRNQWEIIQQVECGYLRSLPNGEPFPPDAGNPPQP